MTRTLEMAFHTVTYCVRNYFALRRTDNLLVQVEAEDDSEGRPMYSVEQSAKLGEKLLKDLSITSRSAHKSCVQAATDLTQSFVERFPGLALIRVQLGDDMVQSTGSNPAEVMVVKRQMPGISKLELRNSGSTLLVKCNKAIARASQILTVELGDRHGNWWECFHEEWSIKSKSSKGVSVVITAETLKDADYVVLQCIADGLEEAVCLPAVAVIRPLSLRWWELMRTKSPRKSCKSHTQMARQNVVLQGSNGTAAV